MALFLKRIACVAVAHKLYFARVYLKRLLSLRGDNQFAGHLYGAAGEQLCGIGIVCKLVRLIYHLAAAEAGAVV